VAPGYLRRPELTAERFVADPFRPGPDRKMYHTGDLARWADDGLLEFFGRADTQIKLRGFRIELGEIEAALSAIPEVHAAAVVTQPGPDGEPRIVGYVQPAATATLEATALRSALKLQLPEYMVPSLFVIVPALPLTASGKIDRQALRPPVGTAPPGDDRETETESASTTLELALQQIWGEVLGVHHVGLDDDFFDLGGHSLLAAKMVNQLERTTGYHVPLATLFNASTVRGFAAALVGQSAPDMTDGIREVQAGTAGWTPFFMLTGDLMGGGFYSRQLANALDTDQPFYSVPPLPPSPDPRLATIEGMAAAHLDEIRRLQPVGPYRLGGYCIGGLIAYEIAARLQEAGEEVELLLLVDSLAPQQHGRLIDLAASSIAAIRSGDPLSRLDQKAAFLERTREIRAMPLPRRLREVAGYPVRVLWRLLRPDRDRAATLSATVEPGRVNGPDMRAILHHYHRAQLLYRHARYRGELHLVRSDNPARSPAEQLRLWQHVAPDTVLHEAHSDHTGVLTRELPAVLREQLQLLASTKRNR
jgi:thioesterase domain-containing protein